MRGYPLLGGTRSRLLVAFLAVLLVALVRVAVSAPAYTSTHFEVYDSAGAGVAYAQSVAAELESAYSALSGSGASLAPPCSGSLYVVNVTQLPGGEGGYVRWTYYYDSSGRITSSCVNYIAIAPGLTSSTLRHVAFHEMVHVSQVSYFRYTAVPSSYPWYIEASAEGISSELSGVCGWEPYYFSNSLYSSNPYSYSGSAWQSYAYGAFYYWVLASGTSTVPGALSGSVSGSSVDSAWVDSTYVSFLLAIVKGVSICGSIYKPSFQSVSVTGTSTSFQVSLSGLSASYYSVSLPGPGMVTVSVSGNVRSNIALNQAFYESNSSLLLALVNPSTSSATYQVTITFSPPLLVKVSGGTFYPVDGRLSLQLYVTYAGQPVTGTVRVNGVDVQASSGYASVTLTNVTWGSVQLTVEYSGYSSTLSVALQKPSVTLYTQTPLFLSPSGYGDLVLKVSNPNQVALSLPLVVRPPVNSSLAFQSLSQTLSLSPGDNTVRLSFSVTGAPAQGTGYVDVLTGSNDKVSVPFSVVPASLSVVKASYDGARGKTIVDVAVQPAALTVTVEVGGLGGKAAVPLSTYIVGVVEVSIPAPSASLSAKPELVAPSWFTARVSVSLSAQGSCPPYPVSYSLSLRVNGSDIGSAYFACGASKDVEATVNASRSDREVYLFVLNGNPSWSAKVRVVPPTISASLVRWTVLGNGSIVEAKVAVAGPHKYLVLGRVLSNESFTLTRSLPAGVKALDVDTGFAKLRLEMPPVKVHVSAPEVVLIPNAVTVRVTVETEAVVKASLEVRLNSSLQRELPVDTSLNRTSFVFELKPGAPGVYTLSVGSWFGGSEASFFYVVVKGVDVEAPPFVLVNEQAEVHVKLYVYPKLPIHANLSVAGCGVGEYRRILGNQSLTLRFDKACSAVVTVSVLNFTASRRIYWDYLNLALENVLGTLDGAPIVGNGTVTGRAYFANGSAVPARVKVDGEYSVTVAETGERVFRLSVEYLGWHNETTVKAFLVPATLYLKAVNVSRELGSPASLEERIRLAVVSGEWGSLSRALKVYEESREKAKAADPLAMLAKSLSERWATEGDEKLIEYSDFILRYEVPIYASIALLAVAVLAARRLRRRRGEKV
ncbi:hypothetical protein [Thermofilum pendens]|uniref:Uncharacterized protein n=1 Tax=Thermofilum pendens (strain DSM 2475 / Hrk 5) TaxID=368408 RepID=A1S136_THEPD|nr:hypothetical protein [Thermofilum pendens]ABL79166.1 hypothetical protein Tpen_1771 [Thermofilum pendens Hrk 5]